MTTYFLWMIGGLLFVSGGVFAIFNPVATTVASGQVIVWSFILGGLWQVYSALRDPHWRGKLWAALMALAALSIGFALYKNPFEGMLSLPNLVGLLFVCTGSTRIIIAFQHKSYPYWWLLLLTGLISVVMAALLMLNFPVTAEIALGWMVAIELIINGMSLLTLAVISRQA